MKTRSNSSRAYVHCFVLYPDNPAQMELFQWLQNTTLLRFMYIKHEPETDEKKPHIHCMVKFENARSSDGVRKSFGTIKTVWRLHKMKLNVECNEKLINQAKLKDDNPLKHVVTETGYIRTSKFSDAECPVLFDESDPASYIETDYEDGQIICPKECKLDEVWRLRPIYVVPHVEPVSDRTSYAVYMLHQDRASEVAGKHRYEVSDLRGDAEFIKSCFPIKGKETLSSTFEDALLLGSGCASERDFLALCVAMKREDLLQLCRDKPYFIQRYILGLK